MIVIGFEPGHIFGGYGDRVVGIISCKMIANLLARPFKILWTRENVKKFINYSKYDYELQPIPIKGFINCVDGQHLLKEYLMKSDIIFPESCYKLYLNQEISQYLYANKKFIDRNYFNDILNTYQNLYKEILLPTEFAINKINSIIKDNKDIVGIQIRSGDYYMTNGKDAYKVLTESQISEIMIGLRKIIGDVIIFLSSDYNNILKVAKPLFTRILCIDEPSLHIDKSISNDFSKVYIDNYILSQKCSKLFISDYSNYGRVAALSNPTDEIYDLYGKKLDKYSLLSKHDMIWKSI